MKNISYILFIALVLSFGNVFSQKKPIDSVEIAEAFISSENFEQAVGFYKGFLAMNPDMPKPYYDIGFCLLNTPTGKEESIEYFEHAMKLYKKKGRKAKAEYLESYFYLARAYRSSYQFERALQLFYPLKEQLVKNKRLSEEVNTEITLCKSGIELTKDSLNIDVENMGEIINSEFADHSPIFSADESVLIFTSRRENTSGGTADIGGQYDEDIFISRKKDGKWTQPEGISKNINTPGHDAAVSLSIDGTKLLILRDDDTGGSLYESRFDGTDWSKSEKLGKNINTKFRETHGSYSADGKYLYFTSDRRGGFGELDIYVSEIQEDGTWGEAKNLGEKINTKLKEEAPYIYPDGKTLYFCSKGHYNLGAYDIFKSVKDENGEWSKPVNIGYPINTIEDDVSYLPTPNGKRAYYSSKQKEGFGDSDLYTIDLEEEKGTDLVIVLGNVYMCKGEIPKLEINITEKETGLEGIYEPNKYDGKFVFVAKRNHNYNIVIDIEEKVVYSDDIFIEENAPYKNTVNSIRLDPNSGCIPHISMLDATKIDTENIDSDGFVYEKHINIKNLRFEFDKNNFSPDKKTNTDDLVHYLKINTDAVIEIGAYADSKGTAVYNYKLSKERAEFVKKYFIEKGVKPEQLVTVSYGEENAITYNIINGEYNEEAQKYNRRIEFKIIKHGKKTLLLKPENDIPKEFKNPNYKVKYEKLPENNYECPN